MLSQERSVLFPNSRGCGVLLISFPAYSSHGDRYNAFRSVWSSVVPRSRRRSSPRQTRASCCGRLRGALQRACTPLLLDDVDAFECGLPQLVADFGTFFVTTLLLFMQNCLPGQFFFTRTTFFHDPRQPNLIINISFHIVEASYG